MMNQTYNVQSMNTRAGASRNVDCFLNVQYIPAQNARAGEGRTLSPAAERFVSFLAAVILFLRTPAARAVRFFAVLAVSALLLFFTACAAVLGQISLLQAALRVAAVALFAVLTGRSCV